MEQPNYLEIARAIMRVSAMPEIPNWTEQCWSAMGVIQVDVDGEVTVALRGPSADELDRWTY